MMQFEAKRSLSDNGLFTHDDYICGSQTFQSWDPLFITTTYGDPLKAYSINETFMRKHFFFSKYIFSWASEKDEIVC